MLVHELPRGYGSAFSGECVAGSCSPGGFFPVSRLPNARLLYSWLHLVCIFGGGVHRE